MKSLIVVALLTAFALVLLGSNAEAAESTAPVKTDRAEHKVDTDCPREKLNKKRSASSVSEDVKRRRGDCKFAEQVLQDLAVERDEAFANYIECFMIGVIVGVEVDCFAEASHHSAVSNSFNNAMRDVRRLCGNHLVGSGF